MEWVRWYGAEDEDRVKTLHMVRDIGVQWAVYVSAVYDQWKSLAGIKIAAEAGQNSKQDHYDVRSDRLYRVTLDVTKLCLLTVMS